MNADTLTLRRVVVPSFLLLLACGPSREAMHARAAEGAVQEGAPLHALHRTQIDAPREQVWALLAGIEQWPAWHPTVRSAKSEGLEAGRWFTWDNAGTTIHSQLALVKAPEVLAWTGSVATAKAAHVWRLRALSPERTEVEVEETMDGFMMKAFMSPKDLDDSVTQWLSDLKAAAQAKAAPERAP
jgi:uncharacterized membrane protein